MRRSVAALAAFIVVFFVTLPAVVAAEPQPSTGRVLISTEGDVTVPAGEHADVVIVVRGTATIEGEVTTVVAVDGAAVLRGARIESIVAVDSPVTVGAGSVVLGDINEFDSAVDRASDARIDGRIVDLRASLISIGAVLGPALILVWIGFGVATLVAALLTAAIAARQVRAAQELIAKEPGSTLVAGILGLVVTPIVAFGLMVTIVGAPLGFGILFQLWPLVAFLGYLVAGVWIGDWLLRRSGDTKVRERPYLAAFIGVVILEILAMAPVLGIIAMIASLFGFGAILLLAWRTIRSGSMAQASMAGASPAPIAG